MPRPEIAGLQSTRLTSFDRQASCEAQLQQVHRWRALEALPADQARIARGSGVSYVAASFDREAVSQGMRGFNRLIGFDQATGILEVEAGTSVAEVQAFALPRGFLLAAAPGHPQATIGGCIAANVHGKNPALDGCFDAATLAMRIFHPRDGWLDAVAGDPSWRATLGGFGLTGTVVSARLQLKPAPPSLRIDHRPVANLVEAAEVLRGHADALVSFGWHDGNPQHFGRGAIRLGQADEEELPSPPISAGLPARVTPWPFQFWQRPTLALANLLQARRWRGSSTLPLAAALTPLNGAGPYFAAFGPQGMVEAQWLLPHGSFADFAAELAQWVRREQALITLLSSKIFAGAADGPALCGEGISLAMHLPANAASGRFLAGVAERALAHGGRPNPIKHSGLDGATLARAVADLDAWRSRIERFNPGRVFRSELSRRLDW